MLTAMLIGCLITSLIPHPAQPTRRTARAVRHVSLTVIIEMITPMFTPLLTPSPWARFRASIHRGVGERRQQTRSVVDGQTNGF